MKTISKLHFITNNDSSKSHLQQIEEVCRAGIDWIQLRIKNKPTDEIEREALKIQEICEAYGTVFIINDYVDIALKIKCDGVHLGKNDMPPDEARKILGGNYIIGGTANTLNDIKYLVGKNIDYVGLGPFRFTKTKDNLSPILGIEGYKNILNEMNKDKFQIPVIAIGGITKNDVGSILTTGIHGVAISLAIANSDNIELEVKNIIDKIYRR